MESSQISKILIEKCQLKGSRPLIVGVSGGADSLCLLSLLLEAGIPLVAAHFNHKLRVTSGQDERAVARFAESLKCIFVSGSADVREIAKNEGLNLEAAARKARYTFLFAQARRFGAEGVAVGHTADDQVETILMHILRGSGLDGLKGMSYRLLLPQYSTDVPLIRPLLDFWRKDTQQYCQEKELHPLEDESNQDKRFIRNRLRLELIPGLETYNPQVKQRLWTLGQIAQSSVGGEEGTGEWIYHRCLIDESSGKYAVFHTRDLSELPDVWLSNVLRTAVKRLRPESVNLDFQSIQRAIRMVRRPDETGRIDLIDNLVLEKAYDRIYLLPNGGWIPTNEWPQIPAGELRSLEVPGSLDLGKGWRITSEFLMIETGQLVPDDGNEVWLDPGAVLTSLAVRANRRGDRFQPFGMNGRVKLSDFFINQKIPRHVRSGWPLVMSGEDVVWVTGLRISEKCRVQAKSRQVIRLVLSKNNSPR